MITTAISIVLTAVTLLFGHSVFRALFSAVKADVYSEGMTYLRISAYSFVGLAMGPAFITVVGQYMGTKDPEGAGYYVKKLLKITYLGGFIWDVFFFALTPLLLWLYDLSAETTQLIILLALIHNTFNALLCPLPFSLSSGLRAAGDIKFNLYSTVFFSVICRVALSVVFGIVFSDGRGRHYARHGL